MDAFPHHFAGGDEQVLCLEVPSYLDHNTADELRAQAIRLLPDRDHAALLLDMSRCRGMSSIGVTALLQIQESCADRGARCWLVAVGDEVTRILNVLRLSQKFQTAPTEEQALADFEDGSP